MKFKPLPTYERVSQLLDYNPLTGVFTWKDSKGRSPAGSTAGTIKDSGYRLIKIDGIRYCAHRLAWLLSFGSDPGEYEVDHSNRHRDDNSLSNLRLASHNDNQKNTEGSGFYRFRGKYHSKVRHNGVEYSLGLFDCPLLARLAYEDKKRELCGEFSPV